MKPKSPDNAPDLFRAQLSQILNRKHPLCRLAKQIDWAVFEHEYGQLYKEGQGRPGLPTRLMVELHYLKYTYNESDETVVARWVENPYWQHFCGYEFLQHELPLEPSSLTRWRSRIGADRLERLLSETVAVAKRGGALKRRQLDRVNIDTTVAEKAIAFPTDARLYHKMRVTLVREAKRANLPLRQSYQRLGKRALARQSRYAHARQSRRAKRETRKLKIYLGRMTRDLRRRLPKPDPAWAARLEQAERLLAQQRRDTHKLYSIHAPEVVCIAKGNWIVEATALEANPYDGHTLTAALARVERISGTTPTHAYCDRGYRGHGHSGPTTVHVVGRFPKRATRSVGRWLKRRAAIEPSIGHLKHDHRLERNYLKGHEGDRMNVILTAAGYNLAKLLAWIAWAWKKRRFRAPLFRPNRIKRLAASDLVPLDAVFA